MSEHHFPQEAKHMIDSLRRQLQHVKAECDALREQAQYPAPAPEVWDGEGVGIYVHIIESNFTWRITGSRPRRWEDLSELERERCRRIGESLRGVVTEKVRREMANQQAQQAIAIKKNEPAQQSLFA